jgi:hypothetical protein
MPQESNVETIFVKESKCYCTVGKNSLLQEGKHVVKETFRRASAVTMKNFRYKYYQ